MEDKSMKILVTGGAGFIGSNFIYHMLREHPDYDIVCLDLLTYAGNLKTLDGAMKTAISSSSREILPTARLLTDFSRTKNSTLS